MQPDDLIRLQHMLDAAREAVGFIRHRNRGDLDHDRQLTWALVKADMLVYSEAECQRRSRTQGAVLYRARKEGRLLYEAAF